MRFGRDTAVLPLIRDVRPPRGAFVPVLMHAFDYAAVEKHDIDVANYEAGSGYFPIRFRDGCRRAGDRDDRGPHTGDVDITPYVDRVSLHLYLACARRRAGRRAAPQEPRRDRRLRRRRGCIGRPGDVSL